MVRELGATPRAWLAWLVTLANLPRDEVLGRGWRERFGLLNYLVRLASANDVVARPPMRLETGPLTRRARLLRSRRLQAGGAVHPVDWAKARKELRSAHARVVDVLETAAAGETRRLGPEAAMVEAVYRPRPPRWAQTMVFALPAAAAFTALRVIATLPPGILRRCVYHDCRALFLANRRQRYCEPHQDEARRERYRTASATYYSKKRGRRRSRGSVVAGHR